MITFDKIVTAIDKAVFDVNKVTLDDECFNPNGTNMYTVDAASVDGNHTDLYDLTVIVDNSTAETWIKTDETPSQYILKPCVVVGNVAII